MFKRRESYLGETSTRPHQTTERTLTDADVDAIADKVTEKIISTAWKWFVIISAAWLLFEGVRRLI